MFVTFLSKLSNKKGCSIPINIIKNIKNPGATPKVIKSERESSSLPIVLSNFNFRATKPSAKSNKAPANMAYTAQSNCPLKQKEMDASPQIKLQAVIIFARLNICVMFLVIKP